MIVCHCNTLDHVVIEKMIAANLAAIARSQSLLDAVGMVFRHSLEHNDRHANPFSCTTCFNRIAPILQKDHRLFADEKLPARDRQDCANCPRLAQCHIDFMAK